MQSVDSVCLRTSVAFTGKDEGEGLSLTALLSQTCCSNVGLAWYYEIPFEANNLLSAGKTSCSTMWLYAFHLH